MSEIIYGPNNLRPASTLLDEMNNCNVTDNHRTAIIVYAQSNFKRPYTQTERSYSSYSDQWGWNYDKMGRCTLGDCLDGSDYGIRLDHTGWVIEGWYWEEESKNV